MSNESVSKRNPKQALEGSELRPSAMAKLAALQFVSTAFFAAGMWFCFDAHAAVSAIFGGLIAVMMSLFMSMRLLSTKRVTTLREMSAQESLIRFYISVVLKIVFTLVMMAICIIVIKVSILPFIIAFSLAAVIVNWLALRFIY